MKIFGAPLSPFVRKVMIYCGERGIAYDLTPIFPMGPDAEREDFRAASPMGKIPAMEDEGYTLADSSAIIHYLEAKHGAALLPEDAKARGKAIFFDEIADTVIPAVMGPMFFNRVVKPKFMGEEGDMAAADKAEKEDLPPVLAKLEALMPDGGGFLVEDRFTIADIALISPFVNLEYAGFELDGSTYPKIAAWHAAIMQQGSVATQLSMEAKAMQG